VDVYAASVVLWEAVTRKRLYQADTDARVIAMVLFEDPPSPRVHVPDINADLERIIMRGLARDRDKRYATAREMAIELETCLPVASASAIGGWVERLAGEALSTRARRIADIESSTSLPQVQLPDLPHAAPAPSSPNLAAAPAPAEIDEPTLTLSGVNDAAEQAAVLSKVSQGAAGKAPPRSRALYAGFAAGAALLVALGFAAISSKKPGRDAIIDADPVRPAATGEVPATPTAAAVITAAPIAPTASAVAATPTARASASAAAKAPTTPVVRATPVTPAAPAKNCKPPYTIDGSGIRHMKPECL
jgi:serine/threonine-protein kinase